VKGIIELRGEITTVIDLKTLLRITKNNGASARDTRFIVLDEGITKGKTGIMVDDVTSVLTVSTEDIDSTSQGTGEDSYILGVIKKPVGNRADLRKELVIWIDIQNILKDAGN
jgi:purine-binding chemotaxis protein CheW